MGVVRSTHRRRERKEDPLKNALLFKIGAECRNKPQHTGETPVPRKAMHGRDARIVRHLAKMYNGFAIRSAFSRVAHRSGGYPCPTARMRQPCPQPTRGRGRPTSGRLFELPAARLAHAGQLMLAFATRQERHRLLDRLLA